MQLCIDVQIGHCEIETIGEWNQLIDIDVILNDRSGRIFMFESLQVLCKISTDPDPEPGVWDGVKFRRLENIQTGPVIRTKVL
jgi:hypothetical protein